LAPDLGRLSQENPGAAVRFSEISNQDSRKITESFYSATGLGLGPRS
jgi:allophanate hydrolase subunit 2